MTFELADMARKDRRERIAVRCLQGMLARDHEGFDILEAEGADMTYVAATAVCYADALIAELDKENE